MLNVRTLATFVTFVSVLFSSATFAGNESIPVDIEGNGKVTASNQSKVCVGAVQNCNIGIFKEDTDVTFSKADTDPEYTFGGWAVTDNRNNVTNYPASNSTITFRFRKSGYRVRAIFNVIKYSISADISGKGTFNASRLKSCSGEITDCQVGSLAKNDTLELKAVQSDDEFDFGGWTITDRDGGSTDYPAAQANLVLTGKRWKKIIVKFIERKYWLKGGLGCPATITVPTTPICMIEGCVFGQFPKRAQLGVDVTSFTEPEDEFDGWDVIDNAGVVTSFDSTNKSLQLKDRRWGKFHLKCRKRKYDLYVELQGKGKVVTNGQNTCLGDGISCFIDSLKKSATVTVTASTTDQEHDFMGWKVTDFSGATTNYGAGQTTLTLSNMRWNRIAAVFVPKYKVSVTVSGEGKVVITGNSPTNCDGSMNTPCELQMMQAGTTMKLDASSTNNKYTFAGWSVTDQNGTITKYPASMTTLNFGQVIGGARINAMFSTPPQVCSTSFERSFPTPEVPFISHKSLYALDRKDNLYVISGNSVTKFSPSGVPLMQFGCLGEPLTMLNKGLAVDSNGQILIPSADSISVYDRMGQFVKKWEGAPLSWDSRYDAPSMVLFDSSDNVYVSDTFHIKKFTSSGQLLNALGDENSGAIKTFAVSPSGTLYVNMLNETSVKEYDPMFAYVRTFDLNFYINFIGLDRQGNLYVNHSANNATRINLSTGGKTSFTTFFNWPNGSGAQSVGPLVFDSKGSLFQLSMNSEVFKFNPSTMKVLAEFRGTGASYEWRGPGFAFGPQGTQLKSDGLLAFSQDTDQQFAIHKFDLNGNYQGVKGRITTAPFLAIARVSDSQDNTFITTSGGKVLKADASGQLVASWEFSPPHNYQSEIKVDRDDNVYVFYGGKVFKYDNDGNLLLEFIHPDGQVGYDVGGGVYADGTLAFYHRGTHTLAFFNKNGALLRTGKVMADIFTLGEDGELYGYSQVGNNWTLFKVDTQGTVVKTWAVSRGYGAGQLAGVQHLSVSKEGKFYLTTSGRVVVLKP